MTPLARFVAMFVALLLSVYARAEGLVATVEPSRIAVSSSYSGGTVVVFGAVQTDAAASSFPYDVIVLAIGPRQALVAWRKERIAGIWVNRDSRTFYNLPSFLSISGSRPFNAIANEDVLRRQGIGVKNALLDAGIPSGIDDPFLISLANIRVQQGLFREHSGGVTFLSRTVFRSEIPLPSNVPVGDYEIKLKLFQSGRMVGETRSSFTVVKVGVEDFVVRAAADHSLIYGLVIVSMALTTGWFASIAFRRD